MLLPGSSLCSYLRTIIVPRSLTCSVSAENSNSPEFCEMFIALPSNTNVFRLEWLAVWSLYQRPCLKSSVEGDSFACFSAFPMSFVSFVSLVALISLVSLCEPMHNKVRAYGGCLRFSQWSLDYAPGRLFQSVTTTSRHSAAESGEGSHLHTINSAR
jgi:hypothetical protein